MKKHWKDGLPALLSVLILGGVEGIHIFTDISYYYGDSFENISNIIMILLAMASLFWTGLPSRKRSDGTLESLLSNMAVSAMAFPMNIDVFGKTIRWEYLLADLWGWHLLWIVFAVIQILTISKLGDHLLSGIRKLLKYGENSLEWLAKTFSGEVAAWAQRSKSFFVVIIVGTIFWVIYFALYYFGGDTFIEFSDTSFIWGSVQLWFAYMIVYFIVCIVVSVAQNVRSAAEEIDGKKIIYMIIAIIIVTIIFFVSPVASEIIKSYAGLLVFPAGSLWALIKAQLKNQPKEFSEKSLAEIPESSRKELSRESSQEPAENSPVDEEGKTKKYVLFTILCYAWIPLNIIFFATVRALKGDQGFTGPLDVPSYLDFVEAAVNVTNEMLELFNIR